MITRAVTTRILGLLILLPACLGGRCQSSSDGSARKASLADTVTQKKASMTPEIIAKAEQILKENPEAAIGTEFRFKLRGKSYIGRIEQHENESGDPSRPPGKHKGVTVYED